MTDDQISFLETPLQYAAEAVPIPKNLKRVGFNNWVSENSLALASKYLKRFNLQNFCDSEIIVMIENSLANDLRNADYIDEDDKEKSLLNFLLEEYQAMIENPNER